MWRYNTISTHVLDISSREVDVNDVTISTNWNFLQKPLGNITLTSSQLKFVLKDKRFSFPRKSLCLYAQNFILRSLSQVRCKVHILSTSSCHIKANGNDNKLQVHEKCHSWGGSVRFVFTFGRWGRDGGEHKVQHTLGTGRNVLVVHDKTVLQQQHRFTTRIQN